MKITKGHFCNFCSIGVMCRKISEGEFQKTILYLSPPLFWQFLPNWTNLSFLVASKRSNSIPLSFEWSMIYSRHFIGPSARVGGHSMTQDSSLGERDRGVDRGYWHNRCYLRLAKGSGDAWVLIQICLLSKFRISNWLDCKRYKIIINLIPNTTKMRWYLVRKFEK